MWFQKNPIFEGLILNVGIWFNKHSNYEYIKLKRFFNEKECLIL